jgi:hypothetical protein
MSIISDPAETFYPADDQPPSRLVREIIALSVAGSWQEAAREWVLDHVFFSEPDDPGTCLCGHYPIVEHCVLRNCKNGNKAIVGNVCVHRFMGIPTDQLFTSLKRIAQNRELALHVRMVYYAKNNGWLNDWEVQFYCNTLKMTRRQLSEKQLALRIRINELVLRKVREGR